MQSPAQCTFDRTFAERTPVRVRRTSYPAPTSKEDARKLRSLHIFHDIIAPHAAAKPPHRYIHGKHNAQRRGQQADPSKPRTYTSTEPPAYSAAFVQQAVPNAPSSETLLYQRRTSCPVPGPWESCLLLPYYPRRGSARHSRKHPASCSADRSPPHASS